MDRERCDLFIGQPAVEHDPFQIGNCVNQSFELLVGVHINDDFARIMGTPNPDQMNIADTGIQFCDRLGHAGQMPRYVPEHQT